jgi:hypothetical protein
MAQDNRSFVFEFEAGDAHCSVSMTKQLMWELGVRRAGLCIVAEACRIMETDQVELVGWGERWPDYWALRYA